MENLRFVFVSFFVDAGEREKERGKRRVQNSKVSSLKSQISAFIFEPIVQGVAGMVIHEAAALSEMIRICKRNNIFTIADEVLTGFGRTGNFFASDYLSEKPDMFCL